MRTDVTVNVKKKHRCPNIPVNSPGRPSEVGRGDWIEWSEGYRGRVVGSVVAPEDGKTYLVVIMQLLGGSCWERWVEPGQVIHTANDGSTFHEKASWLFGDQFLTTKPDMARQCYSYTVDEMARG